jgi:hypothetical protein
MSIEKHLAELTAATKAQTAAIEKQTALLSGAQAKRASAGTGAKPAAKKPAAKKPAAKKMRAKTEAQFKTHLGKYMSCTDFDEDTFDHDVETETERRKDQIRAISAHFNVEGALSIEVSDYPEALGYLQQAMDGAVEGLDPTFDATGEEEEEETEGDIY